MNRTLNIKLRDEELRRELACRNTLLFVDQKVEWHEVERQVERLGFGELYVVTQITGRVAHTPTIIVKPVSAAA
jgi:hypothetical protein